MEKIQHCVDKMNNLALKRSDLAERVQENAEIDYVPASLGPLAWSRNLMLKVFID